MKKIFTLLLLSLLSACKDTPSQPPQFRSRIVAYVHWGDQPLAGKQIKLLQTGETKLTDSNGLLEFSVPGGKYILRAFDINRGGPSLRSVDFNADVQLGQTVKIDIPDCLDCV
jgi:hypothetical protein